MLAQILITRWPIWGRALVFGVLGAALTVIIVGVPTDVIPTPVFNRVVGVQPRDYIVLGITALLTGILAASYAIPFAAACPTQQGKTTLGGILSFLAISCPVCNKLIVLLLGTSGALTWFQPLQPILGMFAIGTLGFAVWLRWRRILSLRHVPASVS